MASASDYIFTDFSEATCDLTKPLIVNDPGRELRGHDVVWIWEACAELWAIYTAHISSGLIKKFPKSPNAGYWNEALLEYFLCFPADSDESIVNEPELPIAANTWGDVFEYFAPGYQETKNHFYAMQRSFGDPLQWRMVHDFMAELRRLHNIGLRFLWRGQTPSELPFYTTTIYPFSGYYAETSVYHKLQGAEVYAHYVCGETIGGEEYESGMRYYSGMGGDVKHSARSAAWDERSDYYLPQQCVSGMKTYAILNVRKVVAKFWSDSPDTPSRTASLAVQIDVGHKELRFALGSGTLLDWITSATGIVDDLVHPLASDEAVDAANRALAAANDGQETADDNLPKYWGGESRFIVSISDVVQTFAPLERVMAIS